jgi:oxygen-independent coproporphyrinogen-3 oxidase
MGHRFLHKDMKNPGLYIHIPFCLTKCPYCGFFSATSTSLIPRWLDAIKREMALYKDRFGFFDSLYVGGGTPTVLMLSELETLVQHVHDHFHVTADAEITIEANPGDLNRTKIEGIRCLGFNRINVGVQSFDNGELRFLGRRHSAQEAKRSLQMLRSCGIENIGVDLMYGLQGQILAGWIKTLQKTLTFQPEHISCYQLTFEERTPFRRMMEKGDIKCLDEGEARSFFLITSGLLEDKGYIHYEISNFARGTANLSRHNTKYWDRTPYLGLGPSAHSFQDTCRWWNFRSIRRYCEAVEAGKSPMEDSENLTDEQIRLESIALGLRTETGIERAEIPDSTETKEALEDLQDSGFLMVKDNRIMPTKKGFLVADHLPLRLCA